MTVESNANFISDLNKAYPRSRDLIKEGDDHIRLVKAVLQTTFPGMDSAVTATSEKLNKLDSSFSYEGSEITINNSLTLAKGKTLDAGGARVEKVGDPEDPEDAVNLRSLQGGLMWPIGSIFMTVDSRNPADIFGFGTWEKFAQGRVIIGTGSSTDINNKVKSFVNEEKSGEYEHVITEKELPKHTHKGAGTTKESGNHNHLFPAGGGSDGSGGRRAVSIDVGVNNAHDWQGERSGGKPAVTSSGKHSHDVEITVEDTGGGESMNNIQPYIACNIWKRTK